MVRVEIGNRIKELRENCKLTREELAEKAEISAKFLYEVEKGRKGLSADTLLKISRTLSCSCDYLLTGEIFEKNQMDQVTELLDGFVEKDRKYIVKMLMIMQEICKNRCT